ncbi:MAG: response regulator [Rhodobacteraceae bacterium]|nr:response regulator [Paracoccaceae bacterium]
MNKLAPIYERVLQQDPSIPTSICALVIDDDQIDRERLRRICESADLNIDLTDSATLEELTALLDKNSYDVIFIDYHLTDANGLEILETVLMHPKNGAAATIMIAGDGQAEIAVKALTMGCSDYIIKSNITKDSLRRAVINALQKTALRNDLKIEMGKRASFETILTGFKNECISEMCPMLSGMLFKIRQEKNKGAQLSGQDLAGLEDSCMRLFSFLEDIRTYRP